MKPTKVVWPAWFSNKRRIESKMYRSKTKKLLDSIRKCGAKAKASGLKIQWSNSYDSYSGIEQKPSPLEHYLLSYSGCSVTTFECTKGSGEGNIVDIKSSHVLSSVVVLTSERFDVDWRRSFTFVMSANSIIYRKKSKDFTKRKQIWLLSRYRTSVCVRKMKFVFPYRKPFLLFVE